MSATARDEPPRGRTGRPPRTSRAEILAAARGLIDRDGWERLTVRRLATELGIGTTTLYHHVRDKDELLLLLLDEFAEQAAPLALPEAPRERIVAAVVAMRDALAAWPWAAESLIGDGFVGRLGPTALEPVEAVVAAAVECGCDPDAAVEVFRHLWFYLVGEIMVRSRSTGARGERNLRGADFSRFDPERQPSLAAIGERWPAIAAQDTFEQGVRAFLDGLLARTAD